MSTSVISRLSIHTKIALAIIILFGILFIPSYVSLWMKKIEMEAVLGACEVYYAGISKTPDYTLQTSFDNDDDGYASCGVYGLDGKLRVQLECDSSWFFNTNACRPVKAKTIAE